jgi:hypothetical protein
MTRRIALAAVLALQAGCGLPLLDDSCGPTQRSTTAQGEARDGGAVLVSVTTGVVETRGSSSGLGAIFMGERGSFGAPLRGHVTAARLVDEGGVARYTFPLHPAPPLGDEVIGATSLGIPDTDAAKRVLRSGQAVLLLETDLPGQAAVAVPLAETYASGWGRASCS